ncbi:threonylcarbamoyl-AMP synthase [Maritimibacter sp. 55A14]|uniref:L-threonylcarbamoyladenylate synthase n=1 Tax=Maritimibacter sp. 55A14 TaxID=2174844 RepID=UPI000D607480|nr:L-threonylcarbamoyladenylate synthase [Maritimibacter sp. 55A14]PWE32311.1 threonylcarbamoyl-AMP synthase [Maritimibacter sp. 55A14]
MTASRTQTLAPDAAGLARAAELLRAGELVAFPTETVYGLGGDARNDRAVAAIFEAKGRPRFNPLIVHVADTDAARALAVFDGDAERLAQAFWPGPLSLVLRLRPEAGLSDLVTAGQPTVALRMPAHPVARDLLRVFGGPLAGPSANPAGRVSPTTAAHVLAGLDGRIAAVVDGGACEVGVESTIVATGGGPARLLRPGGLPAEALEAALGAPLRLAAADPDRPEAPGQLTSHYAPGVALRLEAHAARPGELLLGFGPEAQDAAINLSPGGDLVEAAAGLFAALREIDARAAAEGVTSVAVSPIPDHGLGRAINDRLRRAAAPRPDAASSL